jgi:hypothetical protein
MCVGKFLPLTTEIYAEYVSRLLAQRGRERSRISSTHARSSLFCPHFEQGDCLQC